MRCSESFMMRMLSQYNRLTWSQPLQLQRCSLHTLVPSLQHSFPRPSLLRAVHTRLQMAELAGNSAPEVLAADSMAAAGRTSAAGADVLHVEETAGPSCLAAATDSQRNSESDGAAAKRPPEQSPALAVATQHPQKRQRGNPPAAEPPPMVRRGDAFSPDIWQSGAVLLVDKPKEWTSFDVCGKLRGALKVKKVGHAGTLDPMATGLLIICTGRATKQIDSFVAMRKEYSGTLRLGQATPSYDAASDVCEELPWEHVTDEALEAAKAAFVGDIQQQPPMFSAVSINGERLYNAARRGETVERAARPVTVHSFELTRDANNLRDMHFRIACSKGTYIRSLAHDLGKAAGSAAHLVALRRERIGEHDVADAWQVADLVAAANAARKQGISAPSS